MIKLKEIIRKRKNLLKVKYFYQKFFQIVLIYQHLIKSLEKRSFVKRLNKISFTDTFLNTNFKFDKKTNK